MLAIALVLNLLFVVLCGGQADTSRKLPAQCRVVQKRYGDVPKGPFKHSRGESYKHAPVVKFDIEENGTVANVRIIRSSGIKDLDEKLIETIRGWEYNPRPGCGVTESEMTATIDWR